MTKIVHEISGSRFTELTQNKLYDTGLFVHYFAHHSFSHR